MFAYTLNNGQTATGAPPTGSVAAVSSVTINVASSRIMSGRPLRLPDATGTYTITVAPANLGK
ncbi:hypothetical protein ACFP81_08965 [Deinococcus lacus]|uniref:Uncharacterized protein n=1 Tax=Deinococcus lacus TaxID=392561 RepID=A0ABW1YEV6_9DEIO